MNKKYKLKIFIIFAVFVSIALFGSDSSAATETASKGGTTQFFGAVTNICDFWKKIFDFSMQIAGGLALLVVAVGGVYYLTSLGKTDRQQTAKDIMSGAVFGLLLAFLSWALFNVLNPYLLQCKINVQQIKLASEPPYTGNKCANFKKYETKEECEAAKYSTCNSEKNPCIQDAPIDKAGQAFGLVEPGKEPTVTSDKWCCYEPPKLGCPIGSSFIIQCYGNRSWAKGTSVNWHPAIDIAASFGQPVVAMIDGTGVCHYSSDCDTKWVEFTEKVSGRSWAYYHLGECQSGEYKQGETMGYVDGRPAPSKGGNVNDEWGGEGKDKCSGSPHLHLQREGANKDDPLNPEVYPDLAKCFSTYYAQDLKDKQGNILTYNDKVLGAGNCCAGQNCYAANCPTTTYGCQWNENLARGQEGGSGQGASQLK